MEQEQHTSADQLIGDIYSGNAPWSAVATAVARKRLAVFASVRDNAAAQEALQRLWYHPTLLPFHNSIEPILTDRGPKAGNTAPDSILQIALHHTDWQNPPETWEAPNDPQFRQVLHSLLQHLYRRWPAPLFLDEAWLYGHSEQARLWRECFLCVTVGKRLRDVVLPIPLTARGRHSFLNAPEHLSLSAAARWGQLASLNASERLIEVLLETRLADTLPDEPFWESVVHYFINHPEIPLSQIGPLVDYLWNRRCIESAPEPFFSMKGRVSKVLLDRLDQWHAQLAAQNKGHQHTWSSLQLTAFEVTEREASGATLVWEIVELTDTRALFQEGSELRHCVRSYVTGCVKGERSLFSLRLRASDSRTERRMLTIEVHRSRRTLMQVRGHANAIPKQHRTGSRLRRAGEIVRLWASQQKLGIGCHF